MPRIKDLTGQVFGRLTVRHLSSRRGIHGKAIWVCDCVCGNKNVEIRSSKLMLGDTTSCGCARSKARENFNPYGCLNKLPSIVSITKICLSCSREFSIRFNEKDPLTSGNERRKTLCDSCKLKKVLGKKVSKYDW